MTAIEDRIKELRWKNENFLTKLFKDRTNYNPTAVDAEAKARIYKRSATGVKVFAVAIVAFLGLAIYLPDGKVDNESIFSLLLLGMLFYSLSYGNELKAARLEEIANLQKLGEQQ